MHTMRAKKKLTPLHDESGAVAIYFALILSVLCGIAGLVVDYGNMVRVRAEVQRTADAAALAGAIGLAPYTELTPVPTPNWSQGQAKAHTMISNAANKADNLQFGAAEGTVDYGYWLLKPATGYVQTLPKARPTTAVNWPEPAIKVTLSRDVNLYLMPLVGVTSPKTVSATAIAILPEAHITSNVPPFAVSWDTVYNTVGGNVVMDATEQDIKIQSNKGEAGWFNQSGGNSVPSVRIQTPLDITNSIYLVPGTKATLTDLLTVGQIAVVPVVQTVDQKTWSPIIGFAAFQVDSLGSNSVTGHFVNQYLDPKVIFDPNVVPPSEPGLFGGVSGTPKLVGP
jgi:Flp pilus assembly protein TadG